MNRRETFSRICERIDRKKEDISALIRAASPGDEFFFGPYRLVCGGTDQRGNILLYTISLYKKDDPETRVLVDIL